MNNVYPATYRDRHGEVATTIQNDGAVLSMTVRGVMFRGDDFDALEPVLEQEDRLAMFSIHGGFLCSCVLDFEMPIPVFMDGQDRNAVLSVHLELGDSNARSGLDREVLALDLKAGDVVYRSRGTSGWFEDELLDVQKQLPEGTYMRACINCAFSDYSPYGHGLFGHMACFRSNKTVYLSVRGKDDLFDIWNTNAGSVQETCLCPEFQRRLPGTGYRG